ncbi:hypothetical protein ABZV60_16510 [Streptomyces sp. NPDC004787]|uniref:hypothetical protein n=1 Tax=Streptomyces sp. NPDC004787 TaxID=3154291 RepID=UPI0033B6ADF4
MAGAVHASRSDLLPAPVSVLPSTVGAPGAGVASTVPSYTASWPTLMSYAAAVPVVRRPSWAIVRPAYGERSSVRRSQPAVVVEPRSRVVKVVGESVNDTAAVRCVGPAAGVFRTTDSLVSAATGSRVW